MTESESHSLSPSFHPPLADVALPGGFSAAGVACGIKAGGTSDLALLAAGSPVPAAVVTTTNQVYGAPIAWCRQVLPGGCGRVRAMVINSGCSNVCTGPAGLADAREMAARVGAHLGCPAESVLVASTGVIGRPLPMQAVREGIDAASAALAPDGLAPAARAILTTDTGIKLAELDTRAADGSPVRLAGMAKGSGMIAPSMATMIGVVLTDWAVTPAALGLAVRAAVANTFNAVTVDGDTSTSDIVAVLSSGAAGNEPLTAASPQLPAFVEALQGLCDSLARQIATDGEGATRTITIEVVGAANRADAAVAAKSVANSPLVKTAVHGADPNWGRVAMALGKSAALVRPETLSITIGPHAVFRQGVGTKFSPEQVSTYLRENREIHIACDLGIGSGAYRAYTCDLSREYIAINADYTT